MKIVIVAATDKEIALLRQKIDSSFISDRLDINIDFKITGVGMLASCFSIAELIFTQKPDLIIQAGIAGSFDSNVTLRSVFAIKNEFIGDMGVNESGLFNDLFDLQLLQPNDSPFCDSKLENININKWNLSNLQIVNAITVNEVTTNYQRILQLQEKYHPALESMEGASLHYCCIKTGTAFIQIRSVSNIVGERDKSKWAMKDALENLSQVVLDYLEKLTHLPQTI
jgi:futalosine hydrolase